MPQEIKGTPSASTNTNDKNQILPAPSPADNDKNQAVSKPALDPSFIQKAFGGIRRPDKSGRGRSIFERD